MENQGDAPDASWFEIGRIKQLVKIMRDNDLSEIDMKSEKSRLRLRRGVMAGVVAAPMMAPAPVASTSPAPAPAAESVPASAPPASNLLEIKSPIVGTFYTASGPDAEPFVKVGSTVNSDSVVCIIEAMKVFNEIQAGLAGKIKQVVVENGAPVEFGQVLFRVEK